MSVDGVAGEKCFLCFGGDTSASEIEDTFLIGIMISLSVKNYLKINFIDFQAKDLAKEYNQIFEKILREFTKHRNRNEVKLIEYIYVQKNQNMFIIK